MGTNDNTLTLVQVLASHIAGDKLLSEPMQTQITDVYMRHLPAVC